MAPVKMYLIGLCAVMAVINTEPVISTTIDSDIREQLITLQEQMKSLQNLHLSDVSYLKDTIQRIRCKCNHEIRNSEVAQQPMKSAITEADKEETIEYSTVLHRLHLVHKQLFQTRNEYSELKTLVRSQAIRIDQLETEIHKLKNKDREWKTEIEHVRHNFDKLYQDINVTSNEFDGNMSSNKVLDNEEEEPLSESRRMRHHDKAVLEKISIMYRRQGHIDNYQKILQTQLLDVQRRIDHIQPQDWNLLSARLEYLSLQNKVLRFELKNVTQKLSDFDKVHASILELREDVEGIENKADTSFPELRKEISRLDIGFAQINAQSSYIKEDQENLRQSVKAIAVSVSNAIDRAETDRFLMKKINESINVLTTMSKQHYYRLNDFIFKNEQSDPENFSVDNFISTELMLDVNNRLETEQDLSKDCSNIDRPSGVYVIRPGPTPVSTWCVNGSTLLQRRFNGSVEFNRKFTEYAKGFGDPAAEFWIGLDAMYHLTADNCSSMRIDMIDIFGGKFYAQYKYFSVDSPDTGYVLRATGFEGDASDALKFQNNMEFSTIDRDRDISNSHCARNYEGGWWYSHCQHVNINGKYSLGLTWFDSVRNEWIALASSEMRLSRRQDCQVNTTR